MSSTVKNIPAGADFLETLAAYLRRDSVPLHERIILLPTQRAVRSLQKKLSDQSRLLPSIYSLTDVADAPALLAKLMPNDVVSLPSAVHPLTRQTVLSQLVRTQQPSLGLQQSLKLAESLGALLDTLNIHGVELNRLKDLAPEDLSEHWQVTWQFLSILADAWPAWLAEKQLVDASFRHRRILLQLAEYWQSHPYTGQVLAAGSTGSQPAVATLLKGIANLPNGIVVLNGLDQDLSARAWDHLEPQHPQYALRDLLKECGLARSDVQMIEAENILDERQKLLQTVMWPGAVTDQWKDVEIPLEGIKNIQRLDCDQVLHEAMTVAVLVLEGLQKKRQSIAVVTADRQLVRHIQTMLSSFGVAVNDSAGMPVQQSKAYQFICHIAAVVDEEFSPISVLSLLKHPLCDLGFVDHDSQVRDLELAVYRGPRPWPGADGLLRSVQDLPQKDLVVALVNALQPLLSLTSSHRRVGDVISAQRDVLKMISYAFDADEPSTEVQQILSYMEAAEDQQGSLPLAAHDKFLDVWESILGQKTFDILAEGQVQIWGLLEARLHTADRVILAGLNEGVWPPLASVDPWVNRSWREELGLPSPEFHLGQTASDFVQQWSVQELFLTRSLKQDGVPTIPSRWLIRLDTLLKAKNLKLSEKTPYDIWAKKILQVEDYVPQDRPQPKPDITHRPTRYAATHVETLMTDPYSFYAKHILKLRPLDFIDADPTVMERGIIVHHALERIVKESLWNISIEERQQFIEKLFADYALYPGVMAFWQPRLAHVVDWFIETQKDIPALAEVKGEANLLVDEKVYTLYATADRIETENGLVIVDYKTGTPPSAKDVQSGKKPQLPIEAWIAYQGGFPGVSTDVRAMAFWQLTGGETVAKIETAKQPMADVITSTEAGLKDLLGIFSEAAYVPVALPTALQVYNDYTDLARTDEWMEVL